MCYGMTLRTDIPLTLHTNFINHICNCSSHTNKLHFMIGDSWQSRMSVHIKYGKFYPHFYTKFHIFILCHSVTHIMKYNIAHIWWLVIRKSGCEQPKMKNELLLYSLLEVFWSSCIFHVHNALFHVDFMQNFICRSLTDILKPLHLSKFHIMFPTILKWFLWGKLP